MTTKAIFQVRAPKRGITLESFYTLSEAEEFCAATEERPLTVVRGTAVIQDEITKIPKQRWEAVAQFS